VQFEDDDSIKFIKASAIPRFVPSCDWTDHRFWAPDDELMMVSESMSAAYRKENDVAICHEDDPNWYMYKPGEWWGGWPKDHFVGKAVPGGRIGKITDLICAAKGDGGDPNSFVVWTEKEIRRRFTGLPAQYYAAHVDLTIDGDDDFRPRDALVYAAERNNVVVVRIMLEAYEQQGRNVDDIKLRDSHGDSFTLLYELSGRPKCPCDTVRLLLDAGAGLFCSGPHDATYGVWEQFHFNPGKLPIEKHDGERRLATELLRAWFGVAVDAAHAALAARRDSIPRLARRVLEPGEVLRSTHWPLCSAPLENRKVVF
jgi:hypothetical protein